MIPCCACVTAKSDFFFIYFTYVIVLNIWNGKIPLGISYGFFGFFLGNSVSIVHNSFLAFGSWFGIALFLSHLSRFAAWRQKNSIGYHFLGDALYVLAPLSMG